MDIVINLLFWAHIVAFVAGGSNSVVGPVIEGRLAGAQPDVRRGYFGVMNTLAQVGKVSMVVLLVTGPLMMYLRYGGFGDANPWFWVKMVLVAVMLATIVYGDVNFRKFQAGDDDAGRRADAAHKITGVALLGVLLSAVFAFG